MQSAFTLQCLELTQDSQVYTIDAIFHLLISDADADNEDYNRRYPKYITQRFTGQVSGFLYGKARLDMLWK